jgi:hypothetical protein
LTYNFGFSWLFARSFYHRHEGGGFRPRLRVSIVSIPYRTHSERDSSIELSRFALLFFGATRDIIGTSRGVCQPLELVSFDSCSVRGFPRVSIYLHAVSEESVSLLAIFFGAP